MTVKRINCTKVWIEGDSKNITQCLKKEVNPSWNIANWINLSHSIINSFEECQISHTYRENNKGADHFAKLGFKAHEKLIWRRGDILKDEVKGLIRMGILASREANLQLL